MKGFLTSSSINVPPRRATGFGERIGVAITALKCKGVERQTNRLITKAPPSAMVIATTTRAHRRTLAALVKVAAVRVGRQPDQLNANEIGATLEMASSGHGGELSSIQAVVTLPTIKWQIIGGNSDVVINLPRSWP